MYHLTAEERSELDVTDSELKADLEDRLHSVERSGDLVGVNLPDLDLSDTVITGAPQDVLDLRGATIDGGLDLTNALITLPVKASHLTIGRSGLTMTNATFESNVIFYGARIKGVTEAKGVHFHGKAVFTRVLATNSVRFNDSAIFEQGTTLSYLRVKNGRLSLRNSISNGPVYARRLEVPRVNLKRAIFEELLSLSGAQIDGNLTLKGAHLYGTARFGDSGRKSIDTKTKIEGETSLADVVADRAVTFDKVKFRGELDFSNGDFRNLVSLNLVSLSDHVDLTGATFQRDLILKPQYCDPKSGPVLVTANGTEINQGTFAQPGRDNSEELRYDFADAIVGDVDFFDATLHDNPMKAGAHEYYESDLAEVRFENTRFEGFDFTAYRPELHGHWQIHDFGARDSHAGGQLATLGRPLRYVAERAGALLDSALPTAVKQWFVGLSDEEPGDREQHSVDPTDVEQQEMSPARLEQTYRYAKRGAGDIGDNRAAAEFFVKEMKARERRYREMEREAATISERLYYLVGRLGLQAWSKIRFSESPILVFLVSALTVVLFSTLYGVIGAITRSNPPYSEIPLSLGYVVFSAESLVGLIHAPAASIDVWLTRVLAVVEGFLGAFLIALFVFSLTRAVHR